MILATPCPDRWDEATHASYPKVWKEVLTKTLDPYEIERDYSDTYAGDSELIEKYRNGFAFHPIHGILATHPLKRLKHAGKVIVAGIEDKATAEHVGFDAAGSIEEALEMAGSIHGSDFSVACTQHLAAHTKVNM